jgi:hypothetical protein
MRNFNLRVFPLEGVNSSERSYRQFVKKRMVIEEGDKIVESGLQKKGQAFSQRRG